MRTPALALLACFTLGAPALAAPRALPTNLPGVVSYAAPPAGFDPLKATDADLADYGFPPRPPLRGLGQERRRWEQVVGMAHTRLMPILEQTRIAAGPPRHASAVLAGGATSQNWSGEVILTNARGFGPGAFTSALAAFNIPVAGQAFGVCTGGTDRLFTWVGIDGWSLDQVFQAGTESDAACINGATSTFYSAWYEWFPDYAVRIRNLLVAQGDAMGVFVTATSGTTGRALIINGTTGQYVAIGFSAPAGTTLRGDSAEWIQERPYWNGVLSTLSNYVAAWMSNGSASQYGNNTGYTFGAPPPGAQVFGVTMLDDVGNPISSSVPLGGSALVFTDMGSAK